MCLDLFGKGVRESLYYILTTACENSMLTIAPESLLIVAQHSAPSSAAEFRAWLLSQISKLSKCCGFLR